jgi:hypothetical protein
MDMADIEQDQSRDLSEYEAWRLASRGDMTSVEDLLRNTPNLSKAVVKAILGRSDLSKEALGLCLTRFPDLISKERWKEMFHDPAWRYEAIKYGPWSNKTLQEIFLRGGKAANAVLVRQDLNLDMINWLVDHVTKEQAVTFFHSHDHEGEAAGAFWEVMPWEWQLDEAFWERNQVHWMHLHYHRRGNFSYHQALWEFCCLDCDRYDVP